MKDKNKPGYKKTKIGWIPEDWECLPFSTVFNRITKPVDVERDSVYQEIGIRSHGKGIFHKEAIKGIKLGNKRVFWVQPGALVFNIVFAWEQAVAVTSKNEDGFIASHRFPMYLPKNNKCDVNYILNYFKTKRGKFGLELASPGGAGRNKTLGQDELKYLYIPLPPLTEQKTIADLLSTWDKIIEKTERLIQAKERRLDAYARELFHPKKNKKNKSWKDVKLKTILTEHQDKSTGREEVYSVSVHKGLINQVEHLGRSYSADNTDNYNCVHYGDIVYTKSPTGNFPLGIVKQSYTKKDVIVSPLYGVFTPKTFNLGIVLDLYFSSAIRGKNYLYPIVQKGAKNTIAITNKTFLSKSISLPMDEKVQEDIAKFVCSARKEIYLLKQLAEKYKSQKHGLMQKLLTGQVRVKG